MQMRVIDIKDEKWYTVSEIAEILGINKDTVRYKIKGDIPVDGRYLVDLNANGSFRIYRVSGLAVKKFMLGIGATS